jgi:Na+-driven multidrug efflux pump
MALMLIYVFDFSVQGVWLSIAAGDFISAIVGYAWFRRALSRLKESVAPASFDEATETV